MSKFFKNLFGSDQSGSEDEEVREIGDRKTEQVQLRVRNRPTSAARTAKSDRHKRRMAERTSAKRNFKQDDNQEGYYDDEFDEMEQERTERRLNVKRKRKERRRNYLIRSREEDKENMEGEIEYMEKDADVNDEEDEQDLMRTRIEELLEQRGELKKERKVYINSFGQSPEKRWLLYSVVKVFGYFAFMAGAFYIAGNDYDKRRCATATTANNLEMCLWYNDTNKCVGLEDTSCSDLCNSERDTNGLLTGEGCMVTFNFTIPNTPPVYDCIPRSQFESVYTEAGCLDPFTCTDQDEADIIDTIEFVGIVYLITFLLMILFIAGLLIFSEWHFPNDFYELDRKYSILIAVTKLVPYLEQLAWAVQLFACGYYNLVVFATASSCGNSRTSTGAENQFSVHIRNYAVTNTSFLVFILLIGTYLRFKWLYSGFMWRPSYDDKIDVPGNLDCADQRNTDPPKCCHDTCDILMDICQGAGCHHKCPLCCSVCWDATCSPCLIFGRMIEVLYKYRHYIGP